MKSALIAIALIVVAVLFIWGSVHVFVPRINPEQQPPKNHFSGTCWVCHIVSNNAKIIQP